MLQMPIALPDQRQLFADALSTKPFLLPSVVPQMYEQGFAQVDAAFMLDLAGVPEGSEGIVQLDKFLASWDRLGADTFMRDGGNYRQRTLANFRAADPHGPWVRAEPRPHFQAVAHNPLNGGTNRFFQEVEPAIGDAAMTQAGLAMLRGLGETLSQRCRFSAEFHQFRINASVEQAGQPTPEGMHRDGVDWVLIQLIARHNVSGGETTLLAADGTLLSRITMTEPFSALLLDDRRIRHGVSAIEPVDGTKQAYRDTIVTTMKALD